MVKKTIAWFEHQAFGVCEWWGDKLGINTTKIRMYFIYLSFFTVWVAHNYVLYYGFYSRE